MASTVVSSIFEASTGITSHGKLQTQRPIGLVTLHSEQNTFDNQTITHLCSRKVRVQVMIYLSEERLHWEQRMATKSVFFTGETQPISKTAAHKRGMGVITKLPGIKKKFLVYRKQNSVVYTKYSCIYIYQNICIIHVHTTNSGRPQQWPHALSNKLQVFLILQVLYGI